MLHPILEGAGPPNAVKWEGPEWTQAPQALLALSSVTWGAVR